MKTDQGKRPYRSWSEGSLRLNKTTKSLHLPRKAPPCFGSLADWQVYRRLALYSAPDGFTFCTDCTQGFKEKMQAQGRCKYPSTTFVLVDDATVGKRSGRVVK